jgi:hypothetical protein
MLTGMHRFHGRVTLVLSGQDLTAKEFLEHVGSRSGWSSVLAPPRVKRLDLPEANHTFTSSPAKATVVDTTLTHLLQLPDKSYQASC